MKDVIIGIALGALLAMTQGCSGLSILQNITKADRPSAADIKEANDAGADLWHCLTIAGPPPSGAAVWITTPKGGDKITFTDGCHVR